MGLTQDQRREIERKLHDPRWRERLLRVQGIVRSEFEKIRDQAETMIIRAIVPRTSVKDLKSVITKLERTGPPPATLRSLNDLIGIKVLCPYPSDVEEVVERMREHAEAGFVVTPSIIADARKETDDGYRGYHFQVELRDPLLINNEDLIGIACEVQIKTMLEESWDAKTHDVTYKRRGRLDLSLKRAMRVLSDRLAVLDSFSESLKQLILQRENEERKKKDVVAAVYLADSSTLFDELVEKIGNRPDERVEMLRKRRFNNQNVRMLLPVIQQCRENGVTAELCRIAGLAALYSKGTQIDVWAIDVCDQFIDISPDKSLPHFVKGTVCWALDRLDEAMEVTEQGIELAKRNGDTDAEVAGKVTFAYWVAEKTWADPESNADLIDRAKQYVESAISQRPEDPGFLDTKGFLLIAAGKTIREIEEGLIFVNKAREKAFGTRADALSQVFHSRHNEIALWRIAALTENNKASA